MGAVVVDLDGTLLDTRARHYAVYSALVTDAGGDPLSLPQVWRARRSDRPWRAVLAATLGRAVDEARAADFLARFVALIESEPMLARDRLQPGAVGALRRLRSRYGRLLLVTARRDERLLARQLESFGLQEFFDAVIATRGGDKALAVGVERVAAWIGDTEDDATAARALGSTLCLVSNGMRSRRVLERLEPDFLVTGIGAGARALAS